MKQWVELDEWSSKEFWEGQISKLEVSFNLRNPTTHLIILEHVKLEFAAIPNKKYWLVAKGTPLAPNKPIHVTLSLPIDEPKMNAFRMSETCLSIKWKVVFVNALERKETQDYNGILCCSPSKTTLESRISPNTDEKA